MTEMIERVAQAICARNNVGFSDDWEKYIPDAIAAIKAMREPSRYMVSAVREIGGSQVAAYARAAWPTMIDAALGEEK